jgi:phenylacetate-coenzyme A ligase PaaK-like adenylate-forming protein
MEKIGAPLPIETLPRDELEKLQNKRLRYTLIMAYETTLFWREKFNNLKINPKDIKNREDLEKAYERGLEVTKDDLINNLHKLLPDYVKNCEEKYTFLWTSGFGGKPKRIPYTPDSFKFSNDVTCLAYNSGGLRNKSRLLNLTSPAPYSSGILSIEGLNNYPYNLTYQSIHTPVPTKLMVDIIQDFGATHLMGLSSKVYTLGKEIQKMGIEPSSLGIESIMIGGESFSKRKKKEMEKDWNAKVFDNLGTTESSYCAYECTCNDGQHVAESRLIVSISNLDEREILGENEEGHLLITNLYDEGEKPGIFLINYSIGDITKILTKEKCECGRSFLKIDYPKRYDEVINIGGVKLNTRDVENANSVEDYISILKYPSGSGKCELEIRVVGKRGYTESQIKEDVMMNILSSNPPASQILSQTGDIIINIVEPENLYKGLQIPPGKPRKLIRIYM